MFQSQQDFFWLLLVQLKDSLAVTAVILVWCAYFSMFIQFMIEDTAGGIVQYQDFKSSYF